MQAKISVKKAIWIEDFQYNRGDITPYQVYFHRLGNGDFNPRVITPITNLKWVKQEISKGNIYLPERITIAEDL